MTLVDIKLQSKTFYTSEQAFFNYPLRFSFDNETERVARLKSEAVGLSWKHVLKTLLVDIKTANQKLRKIGMYISKGLTKGETDIFEKIWIENIYNQTKSSPSSLESIFKEYKKFSSLIPHLHNAVYTCNVIFFKEVFDKVFTEFAIKFNALIKVPSNQFDVRNKLNSKIHQNIKNVPQVRDARVKSLKECYKPGYNEYYKNRTTIYNRIKNID